MMLDVEGKNIRIFEFFSLVEQAKAEGHLYPDCHYFRVEYRCLLPQGVEGLLVAGRAISSNHEADGYTRNQPACMVTGQAAGVAGTLAARAGILPREVDMAELQAALRGLGTKLRPSELTG